MKFYILLLSLCFTYIGFSQNMPSNPKAGECYVRYRDSEGQSLEWKKIDCDLILKENSLKIENLSSGILTRKDRKTIKRKLIKILEKGYAVELLSHYFSNESDSLNELRSIQNGKTIFTYLKTQNINTKQFLISAYGNSKPLEECANKFSCKDYFNKNTRLEYRVVNPMPMPIGDGVWNYDNEKKIWCYKANN